MLPSLYFKASPSHVLFVWESKLLTDTGLVFFTFIFVHGEIIGFSIYWQFVFMNTFLKKPWLLKIKDLNTFCIKYDIFMITDFV